MLAEPWRKGPPDYDAGQLGRRDRPVWVITTDREGRTNGPRIGHLHGKHGENFEAERSASIAWLKTPKSERGPMPPITIVPWLHIPDLGVDDKLSSWWNIEAWAEVERPETFRALKDAVLGFSAVRDFLGLQLDLASGNIDIHEIVVKTNREMTDEIAENIRIVAETCGLDAETLSEVFHVELDDVRSIWSVP